jgi:aldose 1-epimerase
VELFTLTNEHGIEVRAMTYGATITSIRTADRSGTRADIVLGFDSLSGYLAGSPYFGAVVGRYANRIAGGRFTLDGETYQLARNNGPNSLHGGVRGYDKVLWRAEPFHKTRAAGVVFRYMSPDSEEGFPGTVSLEVSYTLTDNLSQHTYWNLHGEAQGDILDHVLTIDASAFTPVDSTLIPTGQVAAVGGTPFDFRQGIAIGARINDSHTQLRFGRGYDHNWVIDRAGGAPLAHAARLEDPTTGRVLDIRTTEPGIQFYSGNFLDGTIRGKNGQVYGHRTGLCLETQHFPDSPNHPNFPTTILRPGARYESRTVVAFSVK